MFLFAESVGKNGWACVLLFLTGCTTFVNENGFDYIEMESVWQYLKVWSIYQWDDSSRVPPDPFEYESPEELLDAVGDTLYGSDFNHTYTRYAQALLQKPEATARTAALRIEETFDYTGLTDSTIQISLYGFSDGEIEYNELGSPIYQWDCTYDSLKKYISVVDPYPIVLVDLRGNHGGNIVVMELIIAAFLPEGRAYINVRERDYDKERRKAQTLEHAWTSLKDTAGVDQLRSHLAGKKVAVIIDGESASASEVLAAALKDGIGATLVGQPTYGKGIGQILLPRRDRRSLKITYVQFYGISDRIGYYHGEGIQPDITVDNSSDETMVLTAVRVHEPSVTSIKILRKPSRSSSLYDAFIVADDELIND